MGGVPGDCASHVLADHHTAHTEGVLTCSYPEKCGTEQASSCKRCNPCCSYCVPPIFSDPASSCGDTACSGGTTSYQCHTRCYYPCPTGTVGSATVSRPRHNPADTRASFSITLHASATPRGCGSASAGTTEIQYK